MCVGRCKVDQVCALSGSGGSHGSSAARGARTCAHWRQGVTFVSQGSSERTFALAAEARLQRVARAWGVCRGACMLMQARICMGRSFSGLNTCGVPFEGTSGMVCVCRRMGAVVLCSCHVWARACARARGMHVGARAAHLDTQLGVLLLNDRLCLLAWECSGASSSV